MTFDRFDRFEDYTNNTLSDKDREQLELELASDPALRDELTDYQRFRFGLESIALKQQLEEIHNQLDQQGELETIAKPEQTGQVRTLWSAWAAAAIVVLVAGIGLYWFTRTTLAEQTFVAYYKPEPVARGATDCVPELAPGIRAYRGGNYQVAFSEVEKLPANQPCVRYYRGLIQLALENPSASIVELEQVVATPPAEPDLTYQKAEWYLAMAYLGANQSDRAQQQLKKISDQLNHPFRNKAQAALRDLDKP